MVRVQTRSTLLHTYDNSKKTVISYEMTVFFALARFDCYQLRSYCKAKKEKR